MQRKQMALQPKLQLLVVTLAIGFFLLFGYLFVVSMWAKQWFVAIALLACSLGSIPWVVAESEIQDRLAATVAIVLATVTAALAQLVYFSLFNVQWFERIFNDKGMGEFGMLAFGLIGFCIGGVAGWKLMRCAGLRSKHSVSAD